jgi:hypothetical protein
VISVDVEIGTRAVDRGVETTAREADQGVSLPQPATSGYELVSVVLRLVAELVSGGWGGDDARRPRSAGWGEECSVIYELYGEQVLVASTSDAATALLIAREWLRDPEQAMTGTHTCVVQLRHEDELVGEHILALAGGTLGRR